MEGKRRGGGVSGWVYTEVEGSLKAYDLSKAYRVELAREKEGELVPATWWLVVVYPEGPVRIPLTRKKEGVVWSEEELKKVEDEDEVRAKHAFRRVMAFLEARDFRGL